MTEKDFFDYVVKKAESFGMVSINDPKKTSEEIKKTGNTIVRHNTGDAPYFAFISKDQEFSGKYSGLSFVIFPNKVVDGTVTHCVLSIGIGSATLGNDTVMACNPGFRRSFMKLVNDASCKFFFSENWGDMDSRNPGLKEAVADTNEQILIDSVNSYDDNSSGGREGLLPAACLLNFNENFNPDDNGIKIIDAWLAQYAKWRLWDTNQKKRDIIKKCIEDAWIPSRSNAELEKEIANKLMGLTPEVTPSSETAASETATVSSGSPASSKKYIVLQGAPGCGKTHMALKIANKYFDKDYVTFTQFHAETTYADFVYGIKPNLDNTNLTYKGERGVLLNAIKNAETAAAKGKNALLIIDEINRANLANVLGPVFYLFEANATDHNYELTLGKVGSTEIKCDQLPDNLYVIATMNTADRSLAVVDFALRRRFTWYTLFPKDLSGDELKGKYFDKNRFIEFSALFEKYATDDELHLQPGHSYFLLDTPLNEDGSITEEMKFRLKYELMPLMKEYFNEGFLLNAKEEFSHLFYKYTREYMFL